MFGHLPELFIILLLGLIVFGPEKLPEVAANVGKAMRDVRSAFDVMAHPEDHEVPEDFSTYYYESLARSGDAPESEEKESEEIESSAGDEHLNDDGEDVDPALLEPIPLHGERSDVYPDQAQMDVLVPEPEESELLPSDPPRQETHKPSA